MRRWVWATLAPALACGSADEQVSVSNTTAGVVALALGDEHSCALLGTGAVRCWGSGANGRLGHADTESLGDAEPPAVGGDVDVGLASVALASGADHTCVLTALGTVRCWGAAGNGQLGYGNTDDVGDDESPAAAGDIDLGGTGPISQLELGIAYGCAIVGSALRCWGNPWRLLDVSEGRKPSLSSIVGDDERPSAAQPVGLSSRPVRVAVAGARLCALLEGGSLQCIGAGWYGEIGSFVQRHGFIQDVVMGSGHTCALLEGGAVRCWGLGSSGQLGYANRADVDGGRSMPGIDVRVGAAVEQLVLGDEHTCALLSGGAVRCWGSNALGQLGYPGIDAVGGDESPVSVGDVDVGGPASFIAAGARHTCAVLVEGGVRCWGSGAAGALGYGNTENIGDDETPASAGSVSVY